MSKPIQNDRVTIVCDDCDFQMEINNMQVWLNKSCPKCGAIDLITEKDIETYDALLAMVGMTNNLLGVDTTQDADLVQMSIRVTDGRVKEAIVEDIDNE